jgi:hypothetical protein
MEGKRSISVGRFHYRTAPHDGQTRRSSLIAKARKLTGRQRSKKIKNHAHAIPGQYFRMIGGKGDPQLGQR